MTEKTNGTNMVIRYYIGLENPEERFEKLVDFLNRSGVRRVLLFTTPFPETSSVVSLDYYKQHAEMLAPFVKRLKEMGVETGINMLHTNGHCFYAEEQEFGFRRAVTVNHEMANGSVCMIDEKFLEHVKQQYRYYAVLKPSVIFTDDDIRMISMGQFICLCPEHIRRISERVGRKIGFEEIRASIYSETFEENPVRDAFFMQMREDVEHLLTVISDSVHDISPETEIGIMTKGYPTATADYNLYTFFREHTDRKFTRIRPGMDFYREGDHNDIPLEFSQPAIIRELIDHPDVEIQPELENDIYGFYQKSNQITKMQILWCITNGFKNIQLSIFPFHEWVNYEEITGMFEKNRNYFEKLGTLIPEGHRTAGIGLYVHPDSMEKTRAKNGELIRPLNWLKWLNLIGMPVSNSIQNSDVLMLTGDDIYLAEDKEIDAILQKGALLDLRAAEALTERGYGDRIGVKHIRNIDGVYAGERFTDSEYNGDFKNASNSDYIYSTILDKETVRHITYHENAQILTYYINHHKQKICDGIAAFENENGERFVILPYEDHMFMYFTNVNRKRRCQLLNCFEWIAGKPLPVVAENEKLCVNINCFENRNIISLFNLSSDPVETIRIRYTPKGTLRYIEEKTGEMKAISYTVREDGVVAVDKTIHAACTLVLVDEM